MGDSVPKITTGSISKVKGKEKQVVYFVHLNGSPEPSLVVKGELPEMGPKGSNNIETSIKWSSKLMKNVNNEAVNTKKMSENSRNSKRR